MPPARPQAPLTQRPLAPPKPKPPAAAPPKPKAPAAAAPPPPPPKPKAPAAGAGGPWQSATATWYTSYPECCTNPNAADKSECQYYSGCKYQGMFAAFDDKKPESWVAANNIAAFFQAPNSRNRAEWGSKWKNKKVEVRNPSTGKTMVVTVVDTCDDGDCSGCCTANANKNGGNLLDLESHTARRFYGGTPVDLQRVEWRLV